MAEKQSKTSGELRELVTAELSKHPECAGEVVILGKAGNWDTAMTGEKPISPGVLATAKSDNRAAPQ